MRVEIGKREDITRWMALVRSASISFPGLETEAALEEHRQTVLHFMEERRALCVRHGEDILGVLLFSEKHNQICFLAVSPESRRQGIGSMLLGEALNRLDRSRDITVETYRAGDVRGTAPRALYRRFGFEEGKLAEEFGYPVQELVLPASKEALRNAIHRTNDHEREIFGAVCRPFRDVLCRWHSDVRPNQENNNFFFPIGPLNWEDIEAAIELQKARGLNYFLLYMQCPMEPPLQERFGLEESIIYVMALTKKESHRWKKNPAIEIRDIQTSDIRADLLDVSSVPEKYRDTAYRNMGMVLEAAKAHPEYHWYCAYQDGKRVGNAYALCYAGCVEVDDLWVEEAFRNQYIATTIMKHIAETLDGVIYLHADASQTPKDMYAKMGFEIVDTMYEYHAEV